MTEPSGRLGRDVRSVRHAELGEHVRQVGFDRPARDEQPLPDAFVGKALDHECDHVVLPPPDEPDPAGRDWLVLVDPAGTARLAFQHVDRLAPSTWPGDDVPQQLHLDLTVSTTEELVTQHERALSLGARLLQDRFDDPVEPLYVYADPAGHPFCIFVAPRA